MKKRSQSVRRTLRRNGAPASSAAGGTRARRVEPRLVRLPAQCTLADAESLKFTLTRLLRNVKPVTVDARAVLRIDTASMQLLAAFARERATSGLAVAVGGASAEFLQATRLLGLTHLLPQPSAAPGPHGSAP
jgi:ABC-type transporter Mla MlaB component